MSWIFPLVTILLVCVLFGYIYRCISTQNERLMRFLMVQNDGKAFVESREKGIIGTIPQKENDTYNRYIGAFMSGSVDDATIKSLGGEAERIAQ
jgi:hypothetical protein